MCGIGIRRGRVERTRRGSRHSSLAGMCTLLHTGKEMVMCILRMLYDRSGHGKVSSAPLLRDGLQSRVGVLGNCGILLTALQ
jgi:hypothetical protein